MKRAVSSALAGAGVRPAKATKGLTRSGGGARETPGVPEVSRVRERVPHGVKQRQPGILHVPPP